MEVIRFAFYATGGILVYFKFPYLSYLFFTIIIIHTLIGLFCVRGKPVSKARKIMLSTWDSPSEGVIQAKEEVNLENTFKFLDNYPGENKPQIIHIVGKALSEILRQSDDLNGKLVFGKFYKQINNRISLRVQLESTQIINILVQNCHLKSLEDIRDQMNSTIQHSKQEDKRKKPTFSNTPTFILELYQRFFSFLTNDLNISIPFLGIRRDPFGTSMIHYQQRFGCNDLTVPFYGYANCPVQLTFSQVHETVIVENGKPKVARTMTVNFIVDHRYLDGAKAKTLIPSFVNVFQNPEVFSNFHRQEVNNSSKEKTI